METTILTTLKFTITQPTAHTFLERLLRVGEVDPRTGDLAQYYCERMLQEYGMLKHLPSTVAAASLSLALRAVHRPAWVSDKPRRVCVCVNPQTDFLSPLSVCLFCFPSVCNVVLLHSFAC